jgi:hypothetical protein
MLIRQLISGSFRTVVFLHWCLLCAILLNLNYYSLFVQHFRVQLTFLVLQAALGRIARLSHDALGNRYHIRLNFVITAVVAVRSLAVVVVALQHRKSRPVVNLIKHSSTVLTLKKPDSGLEGSQRHYALNELHFNDEQKG